MARHDDRANDAMRAVELVPDFLANPLGSLLIKVGNTQVLCAANVEDKVPSFLSNRGRGWITAEYAMLPAATQSRSAREIVRGRPSGRTMEIQRLIGRAMRSVVDRKALGERTIWIDCDVLQADGGTRTAGITGAFVAMCMALGKLQEQGAIARPLLSGLVAAVSVGMVDGTPLLDLDYAEDSGAEVDMNIVRTDDARYIELQGTAETTPFDREQLDDMLALADAGIDQLQDMQRGVIGPALDRLLLRS